MSRPTHLLKHEHRVIEQALRAVAGICLRLRAGEDVPPEVLSEVLDFLRNFAGRFHHGREETLLFPELDRLGIRDQGGVLGIIRGEHLVEQRLMNELESAIVEHGKGSPRATAEFIEAATRLTDHLIRHMEEEDQVLFALAEEMMAEEAKTNLNQALLNGSADYARYEMVAARLERRWTV